MRFVSSLIVVKDVKAARSFYEGLLGQKVKNDFGDSVEFEGGFAIGSEELFIRLVVKPGNKILKRSHNFELYFESDNVESWLKKLKDHNVEFLHEIMEQPWRQRVMRFYDPDGHIIEVGEPMENIATP